MAARPELSSVYSPSPRPTYERPTLIGRQSVRRHIWGDPEAGLVADWLYASTDSLHMLEFGLAPAGWFRHSQTHRTVFGADELLYVAEGRMLASNPQTGEMVEVAAGESLFFRAGTWHHVYAVGDETLRVLEFFAPPPSQGTSGTYAAQQPYVEAHRYGRDDVIGHLAAVPPAPCTLHVIARTRWMWRMDGALRQGIIVSTEHLTVAGFELDSGGRGVVTEHGGDALVYVTRGDAMVRTWCRGESVTFEAGVGDAVFVPEGDRYEVLNFSGGAAGLLGVAPSFWPRSSAE